MTDFSQGLMMWVISFGQPSNLNHVERSTSLPDLVIFCLGTKETLALS